MTRPQLRKRTSCLMVKTNIRLRNCGSSNDALRNCVHSLDIFRAAKVVIDRHGDAAAGCAMGRVEVLMEAGDILGCSAWRRILEAVGGLQRRRRDDEPPN